MAKSDDGRRARFGGVLTTVHDANYPMNPTLPYPSRRRKQTDMGERGMRVASGTHNNEDLLGVQQHGTHE